MLYKDDHYEQIRCPDLHEYRQNIQKQESILGSHQRVRKTTQNQLILL
jgi:hypothetical protein